MNATEIQDIWEVIRQSEQSDENRLSDDQTSIKYKAPRRPLHLKNLVIDKGSGSGRMSIGDAPISPRPSTHD